MKIIKIQGRARNGGSCSICNEDYIGTGIVNFYPEESKGYSVIAEYEEGNYLIRESAYVCEMCLRQRGFLNEV